MCAVLEHYRKHAITTPRFKLLNTPRENIETCLLAAMALKVEEHGKTLVITDNLIENIHQIAVALTDDSKTFGFFLCGGCGNGKTTFVKALQFFLSECQLKRDNYSYWTFRTYHAHDIIYHESEKKDEWLALCNRPMIAIDDLGGEPIEVLRYGTRYSPIIDLLVRRYENMLFTIITTNLDPKQIRESYGDRIADRLNEMMMKIVFRDDTFRTQTPK